MSQNDNKNLHGTNPQNGQIQGNEGKQLEPHTSEDEADSKELDHDPGQWSVGIED
ncbi:MAG: hypothetical protein SFY92_00570 [Verrucomicrobiae bacterium]|nr:hypothetical protein [Verrucomicrobiae bacterium]